MAMRESSRRRLEAIDRIVSDFISKTGYPGGDQARIESAVLNFLRENFYPSFPESPAPIVKNLPTLIERTIACSSISKNIMICDDDMKPLCARLAEWINDNYRKYPRRRWKRLGRGFKT